MSDDHSVQSEIANDPVTHEAGGPADAPQSDSAGIDSDHSGTAREQATHHGVQDGPVMDGALDDMSDGGTSKTEASDLMHEAGVDEVEVEQS